MLLKCHIARAQVKVDETFEELKQKAEERDVMSCFTLIGEILELNSDIDKLKILEAKKNE